MRLYSQKDVDRKALKGARIAILGYGSQGRAHALNSRTSGCDVVVGVRKGGASWKKARKDGLEVAEPLLAVQGADVIAMLVRTWRRRISTRVSASASRAAPRCCSHTASTSISARSTARGSRCGADRPQGAWRSGAPSVPAGPGRAVSARGRPGMRAARRTPARSPMHTGSGRARAGGVLETSFAEETETDLFGEQAVLCGGATELVVKGFETLVEAGYQPEVAYYEWPARAEADRRPAARGRARQDASVHQRDREVRAISPATAHRQRAREERDAQGAEGSAERQVRAAVIRENAQGRANYQRLLNQDVDRQIEKVGAALRARMPWLQERRP